MRIITDVTKKTGINFVLQVLANDWQPRLLFWLGFRPFDETELQQLLPGASAETIRHDLRCLQNLGIMNPIKDDDHKWTLTDAGDGLRDLMLSLCIWGRHQIDNEEDRIPGQIVQPEKQASMKELMAYGETLNKYFK